MEPRESGQSGPTFSNAALPDAIATEAELDELLTRPPPVLIECIRSVASPLVVLGAGGKMGPTLAVLAARAAHEAGHALDVIAVSRFGDAAVRAWLDARGVRTACGDLLDAGAIARLPDSDNVIYLVGLKFGTTRNPPATWAINTLVPAGVCERYRRARIVALSTGNVYPLSDAASGGAREDDPLTPLGEYANAAVARERIFEFCSQRAGTPVALLRLYYAVELRYGVLVDTARKVLRDEPVHLANGYVTCIWQGDANAMILRALALAASPPSVWNLCRPEVFSVREIAVRLGALLDKRVRFEGTETATAVIGNSARLCERLGAPATTLEAMLRWTARWVAAGGRDFGKPTHFEVRDGKY